MIKDADTLKRMYFSGQTCAIDADARFTFSLTAHCSRCGAEAFVTRYERSGPSFNRVIFKCSSCFHQFEAGADHISLV